MSGIIFLEPHIELGVVLFLCSSNSSKSIKSPRQWLMDGGIDGGVIDGDATVNIE